MPITMHQYGELRKGIAGLGRSYSTILRRYTILDSTSAGSVTEEPKDALEVLIARTNEHVIQCKTDRVTARDVFNQLTIELRPYIEDDSSENKKKATLFLLGALIHRYFRLKAEYANGYRPMSWLSSVTSCKLYNAICQALQLDKRSLDEMTVVNALEVFRENMFMKVNLEAKDGAAKAATEKFRYETYAHFRQDPNFEYNLNVLIVQHNALAAKTIKEFKAICFMQSLLAHLDKEIEPVEKELSDWCRVFSKEQKDWSNVTEETMQVHIVNYFKAKEVLRDRILELVGIGYQGERFEGVRDCATLFDAMRTLNTENARLILCGGYVLLKQFAEISPKLLTHISMEMGLERSLSKEDMRICVENIEDFLADDENAGLKCDIFSGRAVLLSAVKNFLVALASKSVEAEERAAVAMM